MQNPSTPSPLGLDRCDVHLPHVWASHARFTPHKPAIIFRDQIVSWSQFNARMNKVANALLRDGHSSGSKVAVVMTNSVEMLEIMFGIVKAGNCVVPLSGMLTTEQLETLVRDSGATAIVTDEKLRHLVEPLLNRLPDIQQGMSLAVGFEGDGWRSYAAFLADSSPEEPAVRYSLDDAFNITYSSGTTGLPKGIVQAHRARLHWSWSNGITFGFSRDSVALITTSLYSNGTWFMVLPPMLTGGTMVVMEQFTPASCIMLIERYQASHAFLVPTQFNALLAEPTLHGACLSSLRMLLSAGSPLRMTTRKEAEQRICPHIFELYGFSEGFATVITPEDAARKPGSVGMPVIGFDLRIIDDAGVEVGPDMPGEIAGYGGGLMTGYHNRPDLTADLIWHDALGRSFLRSGDIGQVDAEGFLTILDRKKDMILSGGFNVFPADIEQVVAAHPDVADVTVIGIPDEKWGETPLALVILTAEARQDAISIVEWANARLAKTQRLSRVEFRTDFPRNALGKVLKRELRAPYWIQVQ